ncbi:MAG: glycoside hydrolase family 88 protein [Bacteroidaceae bacterium]|nr:glycoside hydrolase family 88 protein [Bacteroidaceae bacterium]
MLSAILTGLLTLSTTQAQTTDYEFRLKNVLSTARTAETVEVDVPSTVNPATCTLIDEDGQVVPFEVTTDGRIRFQASVGAVATTGYRLTPGAPTQPSTLTYAAVKMPTSRADIAWENDLCAYRMYSTTLLGSEPNTAQGVDVWEKKMQEPVIDRMYNLSNYHNESQYGVDAYSVNGKRLGCGGTAAVVDGKLVMHNPYSTVTMDEQSALRQAFTLTYTNVNIDGDTYTKTLHVETTAGSLLNHATVRLDGPKKTIRLAVGIYEHTDMGYATDGVDFTDVPGLIGRAEVKSEGTVTSEGARFYQGAYVPGEGVTTEVIDHHLCLVVDYEVGTELEFYFGGGWNIFPAGRYTSDSDWFDALEQFKRQTEHPLTLTGFTTLPLQDDVLSILTTVNDTWQQRNPTHGNFFWNRAVYHVGNMAAYAVTQNPQYAAFSTAWAEHNNWWGATGTDKSKWIYNRYGEGGDFVLFGDNQICFQIYADLYNLDSVKDPNKIARALEVMGYEISTSNVDYLWWVDGLFMVMPIMTKLYGITGNALYLEKMYQYWRWATDLMCDESGDDATGLYFRDAKYIYPSHTSLNGKKDFWARGDGWIFACFATILNELPLTDSHRAEYIQYYQRMAVALKQCQQDEGYWTRSLLDPAHAPGRETSGTALFAYGLAWGIRNGLLSEVEYGPTLERAWNYLSTVALQQDGTVGYIQPIGERADPNQTLTPQSYYDFGVGAYLLACAEMSRLAVSDYGKPKLRLAGVSTGEANELRITFNQIPNPDDALNAANYRLDGSAVDATSLRMDGDRTVVITLPQPLDYGRYVINVENISSAEGGVMADNQQRTLLLTVPLTPAAAGQTVTAIGAQSGNPATNVLDNNLGTRWSQQGYSNQWLQVDLGSKQTVEAVDIAFYQGAARVAYFNIQVSTNGTSFRTVLSGLESSGMTTEMERYRLTTPTDARYVRIVCNGTSAGDWNSITEVRVRVQDSSFQEIEVPTEICGDILLPTQTANGNSIVWTSSDPTVLSGSGLATTGESESVVTLTATVGSSSRTFDVTVRQRDLRSNLQLDYTFDEADVFTQGASTYVIDHSAHERHAQLMGSARIGADGLDLTQNTATGFSTNGYLLLPSHLLDSLRSYTVSAELTPQSLYRQPRLYDFGSASGNSVFLRLNALAAGLKYNGGTTTLVTTPDQLRENETVKMAVTFDARTQTTCVYVDGELMTSSTNIVREPYELTRVAADEHNYIGRTQWWNTNVANDNPDFCGTLRNFRLYSLALTPDELADEGIATAISDLSVTTPVRQDVYDLAGRRIGFMSRDLQALRPGIYIVGGRKVIIR